MGKEITPAPFKKLFRYLTTGDYMLFLCGFLGSTTMGILQPLLFYLMGDLIGNMGSDTSADEYYDQAIDLVIAMVIFGAVFILAGYVAVASLVTVGARQGLGFRKDYLAKILKMDPEWYDSRTVAEIPTSIMNDTLKIERATGDKIVIIIFTFMMILAALVFALISDLKLTLVAMAFCPIIYFGLYLTNQGMEQNAKASDISYQKAGGIAEEALQEIKTVSSFNGQKWEAKKYTQFLKDNTRSMILNGTKVGAGMGMAVGGFFLMMGGLFLVGAQSIENEEDNWITGDPVELSNVITVLFIGIIAFNNMASLVPSIKIVNEGRVSAAKILEVLEEEVKIAGGSCKRTIKGEVTFDDVHFEYPTAKDVPILRGIGFHIESGDRLGVVGSTGSGKSTIASLILRYYQQSSGTIMIDGIPIENFNLAFLRENIGIVSQEPLLFNTTIRQNIRYGNLKAADEDIEKAAERAGVLEFIEKLPDKFETSVGAKGSQMSGGQKQRIAISRAIMRNPKILILDEATSALDRKTEQAVLAALDEAFPDCTRIAIAQNLLTIKESNLILMLDSGIVHEAGSHRELMRMKGKYYHLIKMQKIQRDQNADEDDNEKEDDSVHEQTVVTEQKEDENIDKGKYMKKIFAMSKSDRGWLALGILGSMIVGCTYPFVGMLNGIQFFVLANETGDTLLDESLENSLYIFLIAFIVFAGLIFQSISFPRTTTHITTRIREDSFQAMLSFDAAFFDMPENNASALSSKLSSDCEQLNAIGGTMIGLLVGVVTSLATAHGVSAYFSWRVSLVILTTVPILIFATASGFLAQMKGLVNYDYQKCGTIASDMILNYKSIKALNLEEVSVERYMEPAYNEFKNTVKTGHISGITYGAGFGLMFWAFALIFWYGAKATRDEGVGFEDMMIATFTAFVGTDAFFIAGTYAGDIGGGFTAAKRVFAIMEYEPEIDIKNKKGESFPINGRIEFKDVTFSYPNREYKALKSVSFTIEPQSKFAVIGRTGSGKSTVVQLLLRLYDPTSGSVLIDSIDLKDFKLKYLRKRIGIVSQEPVLFSGSIAENISYGIKASQSDIERVAELAQAAEFIRKHKKGYEREVGFKGGKLSGGQKQRVAIARAIIRKPTILLFDEATSALDPETEQIVMNNLNNELEGTTWVMIAHRLKTISEADHILVLESGRILEHGPREELYEQGGYFYNMIKNL